METKFCQSCGMPLQKNEELGTNHDGSKNEEYCCYCYKDGAFTMDCTMDQMIDHCAQFVDEFNRFGTFYPVILYNGKIIGNWSRSIKKNTIQIEMDFFEKKPRIPVKLIQQAESVERFWMMF